MPKSARDMGFKNISAFNYVMLSKQAWSFIINLDNLVSRLYKAIYFPNFGFLDYAIGHNPSYVQRSIWSSKFVV